MWATPFEDNPQHQIQNDFAVPKPTKFENQNRGGAALFLIHHQSSGVKDSKSEKPTKSQNRSM
jgi:hypothetical protein